MKLLLDTHTLLWMFAAPEKLGDQATTLLTDADNTLRVSSASLWEIGIKVSIGKLHIGKNWARQLANCMSQQGIELIPITLAHCERLSLLPHHHKDPFDRLIIAQTIIEKLTLISCDRQLDAYAIKRLW